MIIEVVIDQDTIYHFSNEGKQLLQVETGIIYDEAYDIRPCPYTYQEVEREDEIDQAEVDHEEAQSLRIMLGEEVEENP